MDAGNKTDALTPGRPGVIPGLCLALAALTLAVFAQTWSFDFVNYDDGADVYENAVVKSGLTIKGFLTAFGVCQSNNWIPLTMISHLLDCELFGLNAGGHHLTNVLLHIATVILLFLVLRKLTGATWRSAFVAAVFAVHPLHVQSVAWVAERKDVLSGLFFMLTLWVYVRYVRQTAAAARHFAVVLMFVLGLMSKSMLVTLPFVLLLLDWWPLNRLPASADWRQFPWLLLLEKIPLLILSFLFSLVAVMAQGDALQLTDDYPLFIRIGNALVSYVIYLWQLVCPVRLAVFYPYPEFGWPYWQTIGALILLAAISLAVFHWRRTKPYLLIGWLWYVGMMVPVIGLAQVGAQSHADRYAYLPQIGLYIMAAWWMADVSARWRHRRLILDSLAIVIVSALAFVSWRETSHWKNTGTLFSHALDNTTDNAIAHNIIGLDRIEKFDADGAIAHFENAAAIWPLSSHTHYNLADAYFQKGRLDDAINRFQIVLALHPRSPQVQSHLAAALFEKGETEPAVKLYRKALARASDAEDLQREVARVAWVLATSTNDSLRSGTNALRLAQRTDKATSGTNATMAATLAAAFAETGKYDAAVTNAQRALQLAASQTNRLAVSKIEIQLRSYEAGRPFRDAEKSESVFKNKKSAR